MKKLFSALLVMALFLCLVACGKTTKPAATKTAQKGNNVVVPVLNISGNAVTADDDAIDYVKASAAKYNEILGAFYATYLKANEAKTVSEKYALEAIAEAKLYESGVFLPTYSNGGNYAIGRVAPRSISTVLWGTDVYRYYNTIPVDKLITAADRATLKAIWNEEASKENGDYTAKAKAKLAELGYQVQDVYNMAYTSDNETWDILASSKQVDSELLVNCVDGLVEYNNLNVMKPALAESWSVSDDGLTYTFNIRKNVKWVDYQGREVADVKASDWVSGLQHMTDADAGLDWLIDGIVKGYGAYVSGDETDFTKVGIKANDETNVLTITLEAPCSYFMTMLGYSCFEPLCTSYYESKGGKFGAEFDSSADDYLYAKDFQSIAYCGPFTVSAFTSENKVTFTKNAKYWNAANVALREMNWFYNDGTDTLKGYNDCIAGTIASTGLNESAVTKAKNDGKFADYAYATDTDATAFCGFWNVNRAQYANASDATKMLTAKTTDKQKEDANTALNNVYFRLAVAFAIDRAAMNAVLVGEELKNASLTNGYTPGNFVKLDAATTVKINGVDKTYPAGTYYGEIVQDQLDADGVHINYFDRKDKVSTGFDGWFNADNAKAYFAKACEELKDLGISKANPIHLDYPCNVSETSQNSANVVKQSVEKVLDGAVIIDVIVADSSTTYRGVGYSTDYGYEANYDLYTGSGWGPDYGDPASYLDTMLPDFAGYMVKTLGIY